MVFLFLIFATKTECDPMAIAVRVLWKSKGKEHSHPVVVVVSHPVSKF